MSSSAALDVILQMPAAQPPAGMEPNFVDPYSRTGEYRVAVIVVMALVTSALAVRLYARFFVVRKLRIDDAVLTVGWIFSVLSMTFSFIMTYHGLGRHQWDIQVYQMSPLLFNMRLVAVFYGLAMMFVKIAILLMFLQLFAPEGTRNVLYWICWGLIVSHAIFYIVFVALIIFTCTPVDAFWIVWKPGKCLDFQTLNIIGGILNAISDAIILVLPQREVWKLKISSKKKFRASFIFLIGAFALFASVVRLYYNFNLKLETDRVYTLLYVKFWSLAEFAAVIICPCLPSFSQVGKHYKTWYASRFGKDKAQALQQEQPDSNEMIDEKNHSRNPSSVGSAV